MSLRVNKPYWIGSILIGCSLLSGSGAGAQVTITYGYDDHGRLTSVSDSVRGSTQYTYDDAGNLLSVAPPSPPPPPNHPPVAVDYYYMSPTGQSVQFNTSQVASDQDGDTLTFSYVSSGILSNGDQTLQVIFFSSPKVINYTVSDGNGGSDSATITITDH